MQINTHLQIRYFHTAPRDARHSLHSRRFPPRSVPCNPYYLKLSNDRNWPVADLSGEREDGDNGQYIDTTKLQKITKLPLRRLDMAQYTHFYSKSKDFVLF